MAKSWRTNSQTCHTPPPLLPCPPTPPHLHCVCVCVCVSHVSCGATGRMSDLFYGPILLRVPHAKYAKSGLKATTEK